MRKTIKNLYAAAAVCLWLTAGAGTACAMEAPGGALAGWFYDDVGHGWYYQPEAGQRQTGWLFYGGEWYWFDETGRMAEGGFRNIDGLQYFFYANGHMARNQYVDLTYYGENGQPEEKGNIRVIGTVNPSGEDKDILTDELYQVPRAWLKKFTEAGWQFMFYTKKKYFEAPGTDQGIYYVYHSVDTRYKKVKFTRGSDILPAFGEYVGYAAGCYEEGSSWMERLWNEFRRLQTYLEIPDYYSGDAAFYFGQAFAAYVDEGRRETMERISREACQVMEEILLSAETPEERERILKEREAKRSQAGESAEDAARTEGYGPGYQPEASSSHLS
ncbi:MAG: hypothetical protein Q4C73_07645 [Eubacteriales bacterium]|nr:hypothetical protein [Eubacteriales bacterium]